MNFSIFIVQTGIVSKILALTTMLFLELSLLETNLMFPALTVDPIDRIRQQRALDLGRKRDICRQPFGSVLLSDLFPCLFFLPHFIGCDLPAGSIHPQRVQ